MGFFGELFGQVRELYGRLTASQKIATGLLVTLVVVFMVWFTAWGSKGDYVALSAQPADAGERAAALGRLQQMGIDVRDKGGVLEVARPQLSRAMAVLAESGTLPSDFTGLQRTTTANKGLFPTMDDNRYDRDVQLAEFLGEVIRHMDEIRMAKVVFDVPTPYEGVLEKKKGTASVVVWLKEKGASLSGQQVDGIAALVSGALKDVPRENVRIVDGQGRAYRVRGTDTVAGTVSDRHEEELAYEERVAKRVEEMLAYLGTVKVFVDATIDFNQKNTESREVAPEGVEVSATSKKVTVEPVETPGASGTTEPKTAVIGERKTEQTRDVKSDYSTKVTTLAEPPGKVTDLSVTALVDREGVIEQLRSEGEGVSEKATPEDLVEKIEEIRLCIANGLGVTDEKKVVVKAVSFPKAPVLEEPARTEVGVGAEWKTYGTPAVLGVLVLAAMLALWRMVKKPVEMRLDARSGSALGLGTGDEELLANLSGLDEETVRRARLEEKVKEMVAAKPEDAAKLVTRWVETEG